MTTKTEPYNFQITPNGELWYTTPHNYGHKVGSVVDVPEATCGDEISVSWRRNVGRQVRTSNFVVRERTTERILLHAPVVDGEPKSTTGSA